MGYGISPLDSQNKGIDSLDGSFGKSEQNSNYSCLRTPFHLCDITTRLVSIEKNAIYVIQSFESSHISVYLAISFRDSQ